MIQNLCEIVVWHIFVNFVILISDSNETYRFTMRESNIVNMMPKIRCSPTAP